MKYVDVHAHLDNEVFKDLDSLIKKLKENNFQIINNGINYLTNNKSLQLSDKYKIIKAAFGLHPLYINEDIKKIINFISENNDNCLAIGEIGLDYLRGIDYEKQKDIFNKFLQFAMTLEKPVIVHSRRAEHDVINLLSSSKIKKVVLHCFEGNKKLITQALGLGYYFSIPANITRSIHFQNLVKQVDLSNLLTETDSPYLAANPGTINTPLSVIDSVKKIAELKELSINEIQKNILANYNLLFK